jgi:hypothetical protein
MKKYFAILVFAVLVVGGVSAQQKQAYIKPTVGIGFLSASGDYVDASGMATSFDIDFVNSFGLTLGLQDVIGWNDDAVINPVSLGAGYTYNAAKWSAGGKFMFVPVEAFQDGGFGFDISGTYWLLGNLGITGIMDLYYLTEYETTIFSLRFGVSLKF